MLLHILLILPGLSSPEPAAFFSRPDTWGYLAPAKALADGNGVGRYLERAPGFPVLLAEAKDLLLRAERLLQAVALRWLALLL